MNFKKKSTIFYNIFSIITLLIASFIYYSTFIKAEDTIISKVRGRILLQVEKNGEAWYVDPLTDKRIFLNRPSDAFELMEKLGVGISNSELKKIPIANINYNGNDTDQDGLIDAIEESINSNPNNTDTDNDGYDDYYEIKNGYQPDSDLKFNIDLEFAKKQAGKILLQVENNGEAWYVDTNNYNRYFLGKPDDAFLIMKSTGLGITNYNLSKIPILDYEDNLDEQKILTNNTTLNSLTDNRTYTDPNYNYSFEYPNKWSIKKGDTDKTIFIGDYNQDVFNEKKALIILNYATFNNAIELTDLKRNDVNGELIKEEIKKIDNKNIQIETYFIPQVNCYKDIISVQKNDTEYLIITTIIAGNYESYSSTINSIISSIKFTDL